jgi:hypothetical protein
MYNFKLTSITFDQLLDQILNFLEHFKGLVFYIGLKFYSDQKSVRPCDKVQKIMSAIYIIFLVSLRLFFLFYLELSCYFF